MQVTAADIRHWYSSPDAPGKVDDYTAAHADRLAQAFTALPGLAPGFAALLIGSWGREAPLLASVFGCRRAVCVRAPEPGVPRVEELTLRGPDAAPVRCQAHALDVEREHLPDGLTGFDLALLWEVVEHMQADPAMAVWQGVRGLRVGGLISITTPNALWYQHTLNHLRGVNSVSLRLRRTYPFSTHWREYAPAELADLVERMGCRPLFVGSFLDPDAASIKGRAARRAIELCRKGSGNGNPSGLRHAMVIAEKVRESELARPAWLYPD
ncbi:MAG: hypothetical protein U0871_18320 [Gemmataceae bacterium]